MAEVVPFLSRETRKRDALIREARKIYQDIFPDNLDAAVADAMREYVAPESDPA